MRIGFFFNAQRHQLLHGVSIAAAMARMPGVEVDILSPAAGHIDYARMLVARLGGAPVRFVQAAPRLAEWVRRRTGGSVPPKWLTLLLLARRLNRYDAICVPERTSLLLRRLGVRRPAFVHLDHGAGDRAVGFDKRIAQFDFVLMAGPKHRARLLREGLIRPEASAVVGYPKFEAVEAVRPAGWRPFADDRPVVLYNPHFSDLGSWSAFGAAVVRAFAAQDRYNLILAPHVRLLDGDRARTRLAAILAEAEASPRILVDRGSDRSIDMSYTMAADLYLGDVSSQIYEFLVRPRPCLFLNAQGVDWQGDENYAHWRFGPVLQSPEGLIAAVDAARAGHGAFLEAQRTGFAETFGPGGVGASARAAAAILSYLRAARG
jgi:hypothetical protein